MNDRDADTPLDVLQEVNARCDRYEELLKSGIKPEVTAFLDDFDVQYRPLLEEELRALQAAYAKKIGSTEPTQAAPAPMPETIDAYRIVAPIGRGGMGVVYRAVHTVMNRPVAVKVLTEAASQHESARKRFRLEAEAAARLHHPNIVTAYDAGEADGLPYLVTELVDGEDLGTIVKRAGPLSVRDAVECVRQAALGLAFVHAAGIVHRDVKPSNLLRERGGRVKVLDVGLARIDRSNPFEGTGPHENAPVSEATLVGAVMGTVDFMAPEQAVDPSAANARSDVYSLGCTLYYLLTGKPAFPRATSWDALAAHRMEPPPNLRAAVPKAPPELATLFAKMVAKLPADRPADMTAVARELGRIQRLPLRIVRFAIEWTAVVAVLAFAVWRLGPWRWETKPEEIARMPPPPPPAIATTPFDGGPYQRQWAAALDLPVEKTDEFGIRFRLIPPGKFKAAFGTLSVTRPMYMSATEIPIRHFREFARARPTACERLKSQGWALIDSRVWKQEPGRSWKDSGPLQPLGDDYPVGNLEAEDARAFCTWLNERKQAKGTYRLASAALWRYACAAGSDERWSSGPDPEMLEAVAWFARTSPDGKFHEVGKKQPNAFGLYDMHGNLSEWVADIRGGGFLLAGGNMMSTAAGLATDELVDPAKLGPMGGIRLTLEVPQPAREPKPDSPQSP